MGKLTDDILRWTLDVNGDPARKELTAVGNSTNKLERDNRALGTEMEKLEAHGKKGSEEWKKYEAQVKANSATIAANKTKMEQLRKEVGLTNLSATELRKEMGSLKRQMDKMDPNTKAWKDMNGQYTAMKARLNEVGGGMSKVNGIFGAFKSLLPALGIGAAIGLLTSLGRQVISVRSEFEKYEAVLTNTLGSKNAAKIEMAMLSEFAAKTPFALTELTGAFVKLTNYGLKPSRDELRKYGDLASSVGKGFDQLVEAMADAVTGEYERLKDFGIKASKQGDKVTFTFKEQATTVDNTAAAIKKYIIGLGDLEGVSGSSISVAETLGGRINNIGDAWDRMLNKMGEGSNGVMVPVLDGMQKDLDDWSKLFDIWASDNVSKWNKFVSSFSYGRMNSVYDDLEKKRKKDAADIAEKEAKDPVIQAKKKAVADKIAADLKAKNDKKAADEKKEADEKAAEKAIEILDKVNNTRISKLTTQYETEKWTDERFKNEMLAAEQAYLIQKRAFLVQFGQSTTDVDKQINDKRIEAQKLKNSEAIEAEEQFKKKMEDIAKEDEISQKAQQNSEDLALDELIKRTKESVDLANKLEDDEAKALEKRKQNYLDFALAMGQTFGDLLSDQEATMEDYLKAALVMSLDALHQFLLVKQAEVMMDAALGAATGRFWKVAGAVAAIAAMEAAYQGVRGALTKGKQSGGYADNDGPDNQPAGIYHKNEFIASAPAVRNPTVKPILDVIDMAQRSGTIRSLNLTAMVPAGKQTGGYGSSSGSTSTSPIIIPSASRDPELTEAMNNMTKAAALLMKRGVSFPMVSGIKKMREVEDLLNQTGMGGFGK